MDLFLYTLLCWMALETFGLHLLNGVAFGTLLFLLASGFTPNFGLMRITNMSHGGRYLVGGNIGLTVLGRTGNFWASLIAAGASVGILGLAIQRALLRRMRARVLPEVLLVDLTAERTLADSDVVSKAGWTPYAGRRIRSRIVKSFSRGRLVAEDGKPLGQPGQGRFLRGPGARD